MKTKAHPLCGNAWRWSSLVFAFCCTFALYAIFSSALRIMAQDAVPAAPHGVITGVVTDEKNQPFPNTEIGAFAVDSRGQIFYVGDYTADASGTYTVSVPWGTFRLRFSAPSNRYLTEFVTVTLGTNSLITRNVQMRLRPTISGRVTNYLGEPIQDIDVVLYERKENGDNSWQVAGSATTDENGEYLQIASTGKVRMAFHDYRHESSYPDMYYPNVFSIEAAQTLELDAGTVITNINQTLHTFGRIAGRVTDVDGKPLRNYLWIYDEQVELDLNPYAEALPDENGYFSTKIRAPGVYYIHVSSDDYLYYDNETDFRQADGVYIDYDQTNFLNIKVPRAPSIRGSVTDLEGRPIANVGIRLSPYNLPGDNAVAYSDQQGNYVIQALSPSSYLLTVHHSDYVTEYFNGHPFPSDDVDFELLHIQRFTPDLNLNFQLLRKGQRVDHQLFGKVVNQDQEAVTGIHVRAYQHKGSDWIEVGDDLTNEAGDYRINVLNRGTYRLSLEDAPFRENDADYTPAYYPRHRTIDEAEDIILDDNYHGTNITIYDMPDIRGRVTTHTGIPIAGATVEVFYRAGSAEQWQCCLAATMTDAGGDYELKDLPPGTYRLYVQATWLGYANQFYPAANNVEQAQDIILAYGSGISHQNLMLTEHQDNIHTFFLPLLSR